MPVDIIVSPEFRFKMPALEKVPWLERTELVRVPELARVPKLEMVSELETVPAFERTVFEVMLRGEPFERSSVTPDGIENVPESMTNLV